MTLDTTEKMLLIGSIHTRIDTVRKLIEIFKDTEQTLFEHYTDEIEQLTKLQQTIINNLIC